MTQPQNAQAVYEPEEVNAQEIEHFMETEIAQAYAYQTLEHGQILEGTIVSISPSEMLVDVGSKTEGIVPGRELEQLDPEYLSSLHEGDSILVYVVRPEDRYGNIVLSIARAQQERDWREAERLFQTQESLEAKVIGCNRGGLIVEMGQVRGFAPGSQLVTQQEEKPSEAKGASRWSHLVGKQLLFKIVELDRSRNRLILSERLAMRERRRQEKERLLSELRKGDIRKGVVTSLTDFGAFVDLGGADGLIHLSELSWGQVQHPSEVLKVGQEVEVYVLKVEPERRRIGLSLRQLQPEPWSVVHENYAVGQLVEGTITKLTDFGAFARVGPGIEGLIHISELSDHRITHPREVVKRGDVLTMRIIRIEPHRRRMALSLRQVPEDQYVEFDWREEGVPGEEEEAEIEPAAEEEEAEVEPAAEEEEAELVAAEAEDESAAEEAELEPLEVTESL
ncbi:MAG: S1 RNA-binding domain-containing protein [Anaerolineae bacterium]|nr:S1 RNA-binding domain-containing protein [Anaerolineae bacterium]